MHTLRAPGRRSLQQTVTLIEYQELRSKVSGSATYQFAGFHAGDETLEMLALGLVHAFSGHYPCIRALRVEGIHHRDRVLILVELAGRIAGCFIKLAEEG